MSNTNAREKSWTEIRNDIIFDLKDGASDTVIQILTLQTTKKNKCKKIWEKYASHHPEKKCVDSIARLLADHSKKRGHFSTDKTNNKGKGNGGEEPLWRTRSKVSEAYMLLYQLRFHSEKGTGADKMSAAEIYNKHPIFQQYDKEKFITWDKKVVKLAERDRKQVSEDVEMFRQHRLNFPPKEITARGKLSWSKHKAKDQLILDTKSGKAGKTRPKQLWESNASYQCFSLEDFRKHVYQEKYRQLAGPYWQKKRNKAAYKEHEKAVKKMYHEWHQTKWEEEIEVAREYLDNLSALH